MRAKRRKKHDLRLHLALMHECFHFVVRCGLYFRCQLRTSGRCNQSALQIANRSIYSCHSARVLKRLNLNVNERESRVHFSLPPIPFRTSAALNVNDFLTRVTSSPSFSSELVRE